MKPTLTLTLSLLGRRNNALSPLRFEGEGLGVRVNFTAEADHDLGGFFAAGTVCNSARRLDWNCWPGLYSNPDIGRKEE